MSSIPPLRSTLELCSWKEIASYLAVSVKTAQLWEHYRGLPVRRLPGPRVQVRALVSEIEEWKQTGAKASPPPLPNTSEDTSILAEPFEPQPTFEPETSTRHRKKAWQIAVALALVMLLARILDTTLDRSTLSSVRIEPESLLGLDIRGRELWRNPMPGIDARRYHDGERHSWVGTLGGDQPVALFVPIPGGAVQESVPLVCLDRHGRELWRFNPGKSVRHGTNAFAPPFIVRQFVVIGGKVIVTSHHHKYTPSQIAVLSSAGKVLREYWHPGHLNALAQGNFQGKNVVFLGGINNVRGLATCVVLDPERLEGAASENGYPHYDGMVPPVEEARIFFPRSGLDPDGPYNVVDQMLSQSEGLLVSVQERTTGLDRPSINYHFSPDLQLTKIVFSDVFVTEFRRKSRRPFNATDEAAFRRLFIRAQ